MCIGNTHRFQLIFDRGRPPRLEPMRAPLALLAALLPVAAAPDAAPSTQPAAGAVPAQPLCAAALIGWLAAGGINAALPAAEHGLNMD